MKHIVVKLLALIALACSLATTARAESFAKRVDIGGGRMMYIECHGTGSPTVLLISGTDTASDLWLRNAPRSTAKNPRDFSVRCWCSSESRVCSEARASTTMAHPLRTAC
jgi:hypothetical protein